MIAQWLVYGLLLSTLLGLAAAAAEVVLHRWRLQTRWVWAGSIVALFAVPLITPFFPGFGPAGPGIAVELGPIGPIPGAPASADFVVETNPAWGVGLLMGWMVLSTLVTLFFYRSHRALLRLRGRWAEDIVSDQRVWLADESGPAVVGFLRPRIVLPRWAMELEPQERRLLIEHEAEHIRGGDMWLLLLALASVAALPWNPAVWWKASRLRNAMEIDCDRRVVRRIEDAKPYGALLLKVAQRPSLLPASAAAFTTRLSQLERRVKAMTGAHRGNRWLVAIGGSFAALLLLLASCGIDRPTGLTPSMDVEPQRDVDLVQLAEAPAFTPFEERPNLVDRATFGGALQENYPEDLRAAGIGGTLIVWVFVDPEGNVGNVIVEESSGYPELDQAGEVAMRQAKFTPARHSGEAVPVWIQIPITFATR